LLELFDSCPAVPFGAKLANYLKGTGKLAARVGQLSKQVGALRTRNLELMAQVALTGGPRRKAKKTDSVFSGGGGTLKKRKALERQIEVMSMSLLDKDQTITLLRQCIKGTEELVLANAQARGDHATSTKRDARMIAMEGELRNHMARSPAEPSCGGCLSVLLEQPLPPQECTGAQAAREFAMAQLKTLQETIETKLKEAFGRCAEYEQTMLKANAQAMDCFRELALLDRLLPSSERDSAAILRNACHIRERRQRIRVGAELRKTTVGAVAVSTGAVSKADIRQHRTNPLTTKPYILLYEKLAMKSNWKLRTSELDTPQVTGITLEPTPGRYNAVRADTHNSTTTHTSQVAPRRRWASLRSGATS
jgi:hypothetical protein